MQIERARSFDSVAESYDRFRPRYPDSLFEDLFACARLRADALIREIGCGSGIATLPLAKRGFQLVGLDPGRELVRIARSKLEGPPSTSWYAQGGPIEDLIQASGLFMPPESRFYGWSKTYSTADYLGLLRTHSDHNLLSEDVRAALLSRIGNAIGDFGGTIEIGYPSSLFFARRLTNPPAGIASP